MLFYPKEISLQQRYLARSSVCLHLYVISYNGTINTCVISNVFTFDWIQYFLITMKVRKWKILAFIKICRIRHLNCKIIIKNITQQTKLIILKYVVKNSPMLWIMHFMHAFDWNSRFYRILAVVDVSKCIHRWNSWKWWKTLIETSAKFQMWAECDFYFYFRFHIFLFWIIYW